MRSRQLALLLALPHHGETAMHRDLIAMTQALQDRGLSTDNILSLHGQVDRALVLSLLRSAHHQMAEWQAGSLFVHVSGHGFFTGDVAENARPGLQFRDTADPHDGYHLFWDEFFDALSLPVGVSLTLLPDL
jgi:hypothetical protein